MNVKQFLEIINRHNKEKPDCNRLGGPLNDDELNDWVKDYPEYKLDEEYIDLLKLHNGIILHYDKDSPCGNIELLPLRKISPASNVIFGGSDRDTISEFPLSWLCLSDENDATIFLVYDCIQDCYFAVEPLDDFKKLDPIAHNLDGVLDWIYHNFGEECIS